MRVNSIVLLGMFVGQVSHDYTVESDEFRSYGAWIHKSYQTPIKNAPVEGAIDEQTSQTTVELVVDLPIPWALQCHNEGWTTTWSLESKKRNCKWDVIEGKSCCYNANDKTRRKSLRFYARRRQIKNQTLKIKNQKVDGWEGTCLFHVLTMHMSMDMCSNPAPTQGESH